MVTEQHQLEGERGVAFRETASRYEVLDKSTVEPALIPACSV